MNEEKNFPEQELEEDGLIVLLDENDDDSVIPELSWEEFQHYVEEGVIQGGMIPKLENAFQAIDAGVKEVIITKASEIEKGNGTHIA